jgi:hypothetical protein
MRSCLLADRFVCICSYAAADEKIATDTTAAMTRDETMVAKPLRKNGEDDQVHDSIANGLQRLKTCSLHSLG